MIKIYTDMDKLSSTKIVKDPEAVYKSNKKGVICLPKL